MAETRIKKYVAASGINFEGLKPPVRVEVGDPVPDGVSAEAIKDLLVCGDIKESTDPVKVEVVK